MAGEWIKIEVATANKPEVMRMARILGIDKDAVFGKVIRLWAWFDTNSVDGVVDGILSTDVDDVCYQAGFCGALLSVGWIEVDESIPRISLPKFDRHNGESAKKRCQKNEAQAKWRKGRSDVDRDESTKEPQKRLPEKRREEKSKYKRPSDVSEELWTEYLAHRKAKKSTVSNTVIDSLRTDAKTVGLSLEQAMQMQIKRGWTGFEPSWVTGANQPISNQFAGAI